MRLRSLFAAMSVVFVLGPAHPASAQFGIPKVPKVPSVPKVPGAPSSPAAEPAALLSASSLDCVIEAMKYERQQLEKRIREALAAREKAIAEKGSESERQMALVEATMAKQQNYEECVEAAMMKDPSNPKLERLEDQAEDELDEAVADKLAEQADALRREIRKRAEPACASVKPDMAAAMAAESDKSRLRQESEQDVISRLMKEAEDAAGEKCEDYEKLKEYLCLGHMRGAKVNSADQALMEGRSDLKPALVALGCKSVAEDPNRVWGEPPAIK